jgi:serine protease Do
VIVAFNGKPVGSRDELVRNVVGTKPGTRVDVKVIRDKQEKTLNVTVEELNLDQEGTRSARRTEEDDDAAEASSGYGMTLSNITPEVGRRLRLDADTRGAVVTDVEPQSAAARAGITPGDVITRVNRRPVTSAAEAGRELAKVESGRTALLLVLRNGQETFLTVTKE